MDSMSNITISELYSDGIFHVFFKANEGLRGIFDSPFCASERARNRARLPGDDQICTIEKGGILQIRYS